MNAQSRSQAVLGVSAYYHDSAATLLVDGRIEAAAQEERFSRIKHDARFPANAINYCLSHTGYEFDQLDAVVFYDKPFLKFERLLETHLARAPWGFGSFLASMPIWLKEKLYLKFVLDREFRGLAGYSKKHPLPRLYFAQHHQSHAASAFFASPFDNAAVLCVDGVGEWATTSLWLGRGSELTPLKEIHFPHSLGLLYSAFTQYCGFRVNSGEYKLMGLAPYGKPVHAARIREHLIALRADGSFELNMKYFAYPTGRAMIGKRFERLFDGPARELESTPRQREADLAASVQAVLEEALLAIARHAHEQTGCENLCLAGGVALNCVANRRLVDEAPFHSLWVQPAAGDAGGSLGAALCYRHQVAKRAPLRGAGDQMRGGFLGPAYSNAQVRETLEQAQVSFVELAEADVLTRSARLLADGKVIGWFQGRMEFGPRALGNRSMLADPRNPDMQRILNLRIKGRESFRPFAPAVMAEYAEEYFDLRQPSPYMLLIAKLLEHLRESDSEPLPSGRRRRRRDRRDRFASREAVNVAGRDACGLLVQVANGACRDQSEVPRAARRVSPHYRRSRTLEYFLQCARRTGGLLTERRAALLSGNGSRLPGHRRFPARQASAAQGAHHRGKIGDFRSRLTHGNEPRYAGIAPLRVANQHRLPADLHAVAAVDIRSRAALVALGAECAAAVPTAVLRAWLETHLSAMDAHRQWLSAGSIPS